MKLHNENVSYLKFDFSYLNKYPNWSKMSYIINLVKLINYIFTYNAWKIRFDWLF